MAVIWRPYVGQPDEGQNEQQQWQPANQSSDNAEIARCLTPLSHPVSTLVIHMKPRQHLSNELCKS